MWLEGVWLRRDSNTDEHSIGTLGGQVPSRALRRRAAIRCQDRGPLIVLAFGLLEANACHEWEAPEGPT